MKTPLFSDITKFLVKPELYAPGTESLWEDDHVSKGMLEAHLNPNWDAASRKPEFIEKSVNWIKELAPPAKYNNLLDLGCGPGLYAERFKKAGYEVTGMDFSMRSITYAKEQTKKNGTDIQYHHKNYMTLDIHEQYDVITLIYCDYAVFKRTDRVELLKKIHKVLKPNGKLIFDVFTPKNRKKESASWEFYEKGSFFSPDTHILLEATYQYQNEDLAELAQYIVLTENCVKSYHVWNHFFDREMLTSEGKEAGFEKLEFYGDVAGKAYSDESETLCGVLIK